MAATVTPIDPTRPVRADVRRPDPLAEARAQEAEALRAFRLALGQAERTLALGVSMLAELDERIAAARQRLRQAGYLNG
jgi:hypothetical protein